MPAAANASAEARTSCSVAVSAAVGAILCAAGAAGAVAAAITGCLGTGALGMRALVWAIREAAKNDASIARFLDSPIAP